MFVAILISGGGLAEKDINKSIFRVFTSGMILVGAPLLFAVAYSWAWYSVEALDDCIKGAEVWQDVLYFSYVSFTTVGFGDLAPINACRYISIIEATTGYIALGIFVGIVASTLKIPDN